MLTDIKIASVDELVKVYPDLARSESLELGTRYHKRVNRVMEEVAGQAEYEGVSAVSQEAVEQRVSDLMARRLEEYREATSSAITRFHQDGSADSLLLALNTLVGRLAGFRQFIQFRLPDSVTDVERVRMDTRIEVQIEDIVRGVSKALSMSDAGTLAFDPTHGWNLVNSSL